MKTKIKYKSKLSRYKNVTNRNKAFDKLSDEDKRKEIAWDSLQLILNEKIEGSRGFYWSDNLYNFSKRYSDNSKEFQQKLIKELPGCTVCARGALMLSQIRLGNELSYEKDKDIHKGNENIIKGFNFSSFINMEYEYEHDAYHLPYYHHTTEKLANIMCNIIANGDFNLKDKTDYLLIEKD